jgi:probable rRNA maturation factor
MMTPVVFAYDDQSTDPIAVELDRWAALATAVLVSEGCAGGELTLSFVDEADIAELHDEHMGDPSPTDVLSFPLDAGAEEAADGAPVLLGDVVICAQVAQRNAADHAGTFDDEVALLVVHGVLHVLGHDHAEDAETAHMQARERALLEQHHWRGGAPASFAAHRVAS